SVIIPIACIMTRYEYENMVKIIYSHMSIKNKMLGYIDNLLDDMPCYVLTRSEGAIVYTNSTFQDFLRCKLNERDAFFQNQSSNVRLNTIMPTETENTNLVIKDHNYNYKKLPLTEISTVIHNSTEEFYSKLAQDYLFNSKVIFLEQ